MKEGGDGKDQSKEEIEADKVLDETTASIQQLQEEMDNLPFDKGPSPKLNPPGMSGGNVGNSRQNKIDILTNEIERQKGLVKEKIEGLSKDADAPVKEKLGAKYEEWNSRYDTKNPDEKYMDSITPAQERANKQFGKNTQAPTAKKSFAKDFWAENKEEVIQPTIKEKSMVMEFDLKFGYPDQTKDPQQIFEKDGNREPSPPEPDKEQSKDVEDPEPDI